MKLTITIKAINQGSVSLSNMIHTYMPDIVITPANVIKGAGAGIAIGTAGATITAGQAVALNNSNQYILAQANLVNTAAVVGIALDGASAGQPLEILTSGSITIGGTVVSGQVYVLAADNPGAIAPVTDLVTGNYTSVIGVANSSSVILVGIVNSMVTHP